MYDNNTEKNVSFFKQNEIKKKKVTEEDILSTAIIFKIFPVTLTWWMKLPNTKKYRFHARCNAYICISVSFEWNQSIFRKGIRFVFWHFSKRFFFIFFFSSSVGFPFDLCHFWVFFVFGHFIYVTFSHVIESTMSFHCIKFKLCCSIFDTQSKKKIVSSVLKGRST